MKANKKLTIVLILIFTLVLFSTIAYARPVTDFFADGLLQINNFFENRAYEPYAKTIDFAFFSLLFIAIYMMGARYAFKEIKRPEQVIVILLGLMTAFLLVLADISAVILLPYIHWIFYLLLFILYWWLLKGIQNKFWRFVLALLLTLLTIGLMQGLFNYLTLPEISGIRAPETPGIGRFFKDLFGSFKGIELPGVSAPGVPDYLKNLFGVPGGVQTGPSGLPQVTTPTGPTAPVQPSPWYKTWNWLWLLLIPLIWFLLRLRKPKPTPTPTPAPSEELTIQKIIDEIDKIIKNKKDSIEKIDKTEEEKTRIIQAADKRIAILAKLKDPAYLWEGIKDIDEVHPFKQLYNVEIQLITELKKLKDIEKDLHDKLKNRWQPFLNRKGKDITQEVNNFEILITQKTNFRDIRNMGIVWLIVICYDIEKREEILRKDLEQLLEDIEELVKGKFTTVKADEKKLSVYNSSEIVVIKLLEQKITEQINKLNELKRKIGEVPTPAPTIKNYSLTLKPINSIPHDEIKIIGAYHKSGNDLNIGKGEDVHFKNNIQLIDTKIHPIIHLINVPQVHIGTLADGNFVIGKSFDGTILKISNMPVETERLPIGKFKLQINEYEFEVEVSEATEPIPTEEEYKRKFPIVLRLRIPTPPYGPPPYGPPYGPGPYAPPYGPPYGMPPSGTPYAPPYGPSPYGYPYGAPTGTGVASQTLQNNPNAVLNHYDEIELYFKRLPTSYMQQIINLANQIKQPMTNNVRLAICIPVAGHQEGKYIYESLKNYTYQTADPRSYEIVLLVNHPDKDPNGNPIKPDETLDEINKFKRNYPNMPLRIMYMVLPREQAKIGLIRKLLTDVVLLRYHNRGRNVPDLIIVSNDADNKGVAPQYVNNFIKKFDANPKLDGSVGQLEWDPESYISYPLIYVGTRLFQYFGILNRRSNYLVSSGANFAFRSSIYAVIGGYNTEDRIGEDTNLGEAIINSRRSREVVGYAGVRASRIYTSSRRAIYALQMGAPPAAQWDKIGFSVFDDEVRKLKFDRSMDINYNDSATIEKLMVGFEWVINETLKIWWGGIPISGLEYKNSKKALNWIGIQFTIENGRIKITNMDRLIVKLKTYQSRGLYIRDLKSGKIKKGNTSRVIKYKK